MATLHELQTVYSYTDALDIFETIQVADYNKWVVDDLHQQEAKRKHKIK